MGHVRLLIKTTPGVSKNYIYVWLALRIKGIFVVCLIERAVADDGEVVPLDSCAIC